MKVAILGASGILGQHLHISVPPGIEAVFMRRRGSGLYQEFDAQSIFLVDNPIRSFNPDVVINLIGQNSPDQAEKEPGNGINYLFPHLLADTCSKIGAHLIHLSSQAAVDPVNLYGKHKAKADKTLRDEWKNWTIVRPTFVLGIRPFPVIGRENPAERILAGRETHSVDNRYFAVSFAWDVAELLWRIAQDQEKYRGQEINVGHPDRFNRYSLAKMLGANPEPVTQEWAESTWGIAPRPLDTSAPYANAFHICDTSINIGVLKVKAEDQELDGVERRAREIAAFLHIDEGTVRTVIDKGFGPLHNAVTEDFQEHTAYCEQMYEPNEEHLLDWYRTTEAYIWELTAYHCDPGFNYAGMCKGILETLKAKRQRTQDAMDALWQGVDKIPIVPTLRVLCLGDGVGSLTIALKEGGLEPVYHDLAGSRTAAFAAARFEMRFAEPIDKRLSMNFKPFEYYWNRPLHVSETEEIKRTGLPFDAVVSLDYLEHVPNVEEWIDAIYGILKPGGVFCAQNAFGMGSGPDGAMPMHLACNDRFEKDWDPLLAKVGFRQLASNWYEKPVLPASVMQPDSVPAHRVAEWPTE